MSSAAADTLEKVSSEFESEAIGTHESGRKETLAKVESVRKEPTGAVAKIIETGAKQAESAKRQIIGTAELEARNSQLKSLEKAVNEVFETATRKVSASSGDQYEAAMGRLIQEGLDVIGPRAKVQCASKDRKVVAAAIKKLAGKENVSLEEEPIETMGGIIMSTPDGSVRFDNTFEARLERMTPILRKEVAAILTGTG